MSFNSHCFSEREQRISKDNLYMVLALWMEEFKPMYFISSSLSDTCIQQDYNKVGVVFVRPNNRVLTADCSRDDIHGVARVIVKHGNNVQDCRVYVSRKPCTTCAKLLVQAKVSRVFYLPIEPETKGDRGKLTNDEVDLIYKSSNVGQSVFIPHVEDTVQSKLERKRPLNTTYNDVKNCQDKLMEKWWGDGSKMLRWSALNNEIINQIKKDFMSLMRWIANIKAPFDKPNLFVKIDNKLDADLKKTKINAYYKHAMIFAKMLSYQTDEPKTGVGAVLINNDEIIGLGWNGYPTNALYGELPRASDDDEANGKKYPYVIHAEQNALMARNMIDLTNGTLIVTKCPCNECAPLVRLSGVGTVVVGEEIYKSKGGVLKYTKIQDYIKDKRAYTIMAAMAETIE